MPANTKAQNMMPMRELSFISVRGRRATGVAFSGAALSFSPVSGSYA